MSGERTFLGWDRPVLPAAAEHLLDRYLRDGVADMREVTVVLPGSRARRRLVELLLQGAEERRAVLVPPRTTTVNGLADTLAPSAGPTADPIVRQRAWSLALRPGDRGPVNRRTVEAIFPNLPDPVPLREWDALAALVSQLHVELAGEGHRFSDVARVCRGGASYDDGERWDALARVQDRYERVLARVGLKDRHLERMTAAAPASAGDIWLVAVADVPSVTRRLLERAAEHGHAVRSLVHAPEELADTDAFDTLGLPATEYWERADVPVTDDVLEMVDTPAHQADAVLAALGALGGAVGPDQVVVGVNPRSEVIPYVQQRLAAAGSAGRYGGGTPLSRTGPVRLLQSVAGYVDGRTYHALAALLRHPAGEVLARAAASRHASADGQVADAVEADIADAWYNEHLPFTVGKGGPRGWKESAAFADLVVALEQEGPLARLRGSRRISHWMPLLRDVLLVAYGGAELDRTHPRDRRVLDVLERIRTAAVALASLPGELNESCEAGDAVRILLAALGDEGIPPDPDRNAVELLDWLEVPLDDAPVLVLTGFNEGLLPESVQGHPFLPDTLRAALGLADNRRRMARDAYRLTAVLHSRRFVRLVAGRRSAQGDPLRPSRLMFRIPQDELPARVLRFLHRETPGVGPIDALSALALRPAESSGFSTPPEPVIERADRGSLSVTAFKALLDDPYRFALQVLLGLGGDDDDARELDALGFGNLAHDVLKGFGRMAAATPPQVDASDENAVAHALERLLEAEVRQRFGEGALPAVHLQARLLKARLRAFAARQAAWAADGWRTVAVEVRQAEGFPFEVDGTPFTLRGRIDRVDHNPATGAWALLDYKTGKAQSPDKAHRKGKGEGRRWVDLQLPLYRHLARGLTGPDGAPLIPTSAFDEDRVGLGYVVLPGDTTECGFLLAEWNADDLVAADETARGAIRTLREGRFVFDADVTRSGGADRDDLHPLLARGWSAAADDEGDADDAQGGTE